MSVISWNDTRWDLFTCGACFCILEVNYLLGTLNQETLIIFLPRQLKEISSHQGIDLLCLGRKMANVATFVTMGCPLKCQIINESFSVALIKHLITKMSPTSTCTIFWNRILQSTAMKHSETCQCTDELGNTQAAVPNISTIMRPIYVPYTIKIVQVARRNHMMMGTIIVRNKA